MPPMPVSSVPRRIRVLPNEMPRLRALLLTYAITRSEFADAADIPPSYLGLLFKGVQPGIRTRAKIAHGLEVLGLAEEWEAQHATR